MGRFRDALAAPGLSALAEVKRRSPSAGDLRPTADPAALAPAFECAGAAAVSVLVDARFGGDVADLAAATTTVILTTCTGAVFALTSVATVRGNGQAPSSAIVWSQVMQDVTTPLTN